MGSRAKISLTEAGKKYLVKCHPPGILWDHDPDKPYDVVAATAWEFHITQDGIPMSLPHKVDGERTYQTGEERRASAYASKAWERAREEGVEE